MSKALMLAICAVTLVQASISPIAMTGQPIANKMFLVGGLIGWVVLSLAAITDYINQKESDQL